MEVADGGTLFLDEVGEMVPEIQSKFLRVLDSGTFYRVGATRKRRADFRLVCATNRDLKGEVAAGRFRKDLFYRINGVKVVIPPLRQRPEDIPLLVDHFADSSPTRRASPPAALAALSAYDWPGNVRELHFAVERAVLLAEGEKIELRDLPPEIVEKSGRTAVALPTSPAPDDEPRQEDDGLDTDDIVIPPPSGGEGPDAERVRAALEKAKWRREKAAEILGVSPRTLYRWIKKLGPLGSVRDAVRGRREGRALRLPEDREAQGHLDDLLGEQPRPDAQVEARDRPREPAPELRAAAGDEKVHDREVERLLFGGGGGGPGRPGQPHPVTTAPEQAGQRLAAPGVGFDEEDRAGGCHALLLSNRRTTRPDWKQRT